MKPKLIFIVIVFAVLGFSGCQQYNRIFRPDKLIFHDGTDSTIKGLKMTDIDSIYQINDNSFQMCSGSMLSLKYENARQFIATYTVTLRYGSTVKIHFRTVAKYFEKNEKLTFSYGLTGSKLFYNGKEILANPSLKATINEPKLITIINDGKYFSIKVDCDYFYTGETSLPNTEYNIIETDSATRAEFKGINMVELYDELDEKLHYYH
ncbi:MAG: hypothetical protein NT007_18440 [Candidatus Kapabacteria bacterium]|nr:hypothetical protein [Candidatus Kapabacteria bacterium]